MDKKVIIHNQTVIDGLTKDTDNMVLSNTYTFEELKVISKFFDDWLRDSYIRGGDAIEVFGYDLTCDDTEKEDKVLIGQDVIDFIQDNNLDKERVLNCEIKFDVRLKDDARNNLSNNYELTVVL